MVPLTSLLIPIVLSGIAVFIASSVIHMVLGYHRTDLRGVSDESAVMQALRPFNLQPGDYAVPFAGSMEGMKSPEFQEKMKAGPVIFTTVAPRGLQSMERSLALWFVYSLAVSAFAAYVAGRALGPASPYLSVFRFVGTTAFVGYSMALLQNSIWWRRNWSMTLRSMFDGLIYTLLSAGIFGWLWPH